VADLVLLIMDGSIGFEMETFECISMMKQIGFRNCMGVVTHMDFFKENKSMRAQKKMMKERFRKEVGDDFKLFFLSGLHYDLYRDSDI
jgi:ribosome biogenesis protein BMS1